MMLISLSGHSYNANNVITHYNLSPGSAQWSYTPNRCFPAGHLQKLHNMTTVEACKNACVSQEHCQSVDYYGDNATCKLQQQSMYWSNEDRYCLGSDHYEALHSEIGVARHRRY